MKTYSDAVNLLTSSAKFRISLGLERIFAILEILGNPQDRLNCIHVAGTNGKGSVCAILASILSYAGKKVGLYASPHIFKYTERIQINGIKISEQDFAQYIFEITKLADDNEIDLTEFEILTAVMFKYFADNNVDVVVLETGLGGRFDATNVIKKNICSVITHVDYDHTERLGDTLDKIAFEKAGIIKPNCPCFVIEGKEVYYDMTMKAGAPLEIIAPFCDTSSLALKGSYQQENLALALAVINQCFPEISKEQIENGLKNVKHSCRFQYIKDKNLIIDGAHNPNGIVSLKDSLDNIYPYEKRRFIFGCLKNKDYKKMLSILFNEGDEVYFYHFQHKNSAEIDQLKINCPIKSKELKNAEQINFLDGKLNIICGSFYMIAELVELFNIKI
ncbi:bifunctional folylpolyglutamate synthase/dihydrofolate synthase [bacterium]|nr:bifunctional folylpolyglutamate synthase/dihydrofolate synthase [bacterium]